MTKLLTLIGIVFLGAGLLPAQSLTSLNGIVTDPSGAVVPGATVILENVATQATRQTTSDEAGRYIFPQMPPGNYRVRARAQGFSEVTVNDVRLMVSTPVTINIILKVGPVAEAVQVTAEGAQVNTTDATIGNAYGDRKSVV